MNTSFLKSPNRRLLNKKRHLLNKKHHPQNGHNYGSATALGSAALLLLGLAPAQAQASYTATFPGGATTNFSAAGLPGTTTLADTLTFNTSGTGVAVGTDDLAALNANTLTFSNALALTLNRGAGTKITLGGTTSTVNLSNTAAITDNLDTVLTSNTTTFAGNGSNATFAGNFTTSGITGAATLNLGSSTSTGTGNLLSGTISDSGTTGGLIIAKNGAGTWTFGGNGTSTLAKANLTLTGGTFNFGSVTDAPILSIGGDANGTSTGVFLTSGSFNMKAGTLAVTNSQGFAIAGSQTYTQTGGTFSTNGRIEFSNNGGASVVNVSNGTLATSASTGIETVRGTTTISLSGTGSITASLLNMTTNQLSGGAAGSIFNLNGGTFNTGQIIPGSNGTTGTGTIFNFNGGTLKASASTATFMQGLTNAFVKSGGAVIDTNTFNDTIAQNILTDTASTGGGLTKNGTGILTLSGTSTYTGATTITAGTLQLGDGTSSATDGTINNTSGIVDNATLTFNRFGSVSSSTAISGTGTVTKIGAGTQTLTGANTYTGATAVNAGVLTIGNGTTGSIANVTSATNTLSIGNAAGNSVLNINSGSLSDTANLTYIGNASGAASALNLASGTFTSTLADGDGTGGVVGQVGYGALNVSGGTLNLPRIYAGSANAGTGVVNISGGSVIVTGGFDFIINRGSNAATDVVAVSGGTLNTTASGLYVGFQGTGKAQLNVTGGTINNSARSLNYGSSWTGTGIVNLDAGTLQTNSITANGGTDLINFNGGTLKGGTANSTAFVPATVTAAYVNGAFGTFAGGAVLDTNGQSETIAANLLAPTGSGVTGLAVTGGTGYVGAPVVSISGMGTGATAIANIDASGNLTGITVTNPGVDYTGTPTFTLSGGGGTGATPGTVSTAANTSGGLVKQGAGTLTLTAANTYTGATTVSTGTLAVNGSTAAGSAVTVASGATLTGTGTAAGAVTDNGTLNAGGVGTVGTFTTGADTYGAGSSLVFDFGNNNVDELFSTGLVSGLSNSAFTFTQLTGSTGLTNASYTLIAAANGFSSTALPSGATPAGYQLQFSGSNLNLVQIAAAPEPSQWVALLMGVLGLGGLSLKARRRAA